MESLYFLLLYGFSAFFSASEAAFLSLNRPQLEAIRLKDTESYRRIRNLIFRPENLLATFVIGNEIVNILLSMKVSFWVDYYLGDQSYFLKVVISTVVATLSLITLSEILPKVFGYRLATFLAPNLSFLVEKIYRLLSPIRGLLLASSRGILSVFGVKSVLPTIIDEKDFLFLVEEGTKLGSLDKEEKDFIHNVFEFSDLSVSEILIPWAKVVKLSKEVKLKDMEAFLRETPFSRIPIWDSAKEAVIGILYTKELFQFYLKAPLQSMETSIESIAFPPLIVSSHMKIAKLFREFKKKKVHMAIVVDEFGKYAGLVTLEDLLNRLFRTV